MWSDRCTHCLDSHTGARPCLASATERTRAWLLIEHPGPWARRLEDTALPPPVSRALERAREHAVRVRAGRVGRAGRGTGHRRRGQPGRGALPGPRRTGTARAVRPRVHGRHEHLRAEGTRPARGSSRRLTRAGNSLLPARVRPGTRSCPVGGRGGEHRGEREGRGHDAEGVRGYRRPRTGDPAQVQGAERGDADRPGDLQAGGQHAADVGRVARRRRGKPPPM
jgi:hypothetical protein